jgi:hypothetical protein
MNRRVLLTAFVLALPPAVVLAPGAPWGGPAPAAASVSVLVSLDDLVSASTAVVVGTVGEHHSVWEDLPNGRRIVTYTKVTVERTVLGAHQGELWVRTLGGAVGNIGQAVEGDARLEAGSRAMLFLTEANGVVVCTAMAQGHFPVVADDHGVQRLAQSPNAGMLVPKRGPTISAQERLVGAALDEAVAVVQKMGKARDEKK